MDWMKIEIVTDNVEVTIGALSAINIHEVEIVESYDKMVQELAKQAEYWDFVDEAKLKRQNEKEKVIVYLADTMAAQIKLEQIRQQIDQVNHMGLCRMHIDVDSFKDEDWVNNWKRFFQPIPVGENLLIAPVWEDPIETNRMLLRIDPGMIFGTGAHITTQLCLSLLEKLVQPGDAFLDLGCGSGILSILALQLGAASALGVDIDSGAKKVVARHALINGLETEPEVIIGDLFMDEDVIGRVCHNQYDLVAANIVADVIIKLLPLVKRCLKPGKLFICSGIIDDRAEEVKSALTEAGFAVFNQYEQKEWTAFATRRKE